MLEIVEIAVVIVTVGGLITWAIMERKK